MSESRQTQSAPRLHARLPLDWCCRFLLHQLLMAWLQTAKNELGWLKNERGMNDKTMLIGRHF
ncbi:hypothetical protein ADJ79_01615 [Ottowia sp. oral taxon 894]|nr:hypothetical protein ADJ79_01615 [Ottowia sp. oral taxon 894]